MTSYYYNFTFLDVCDYIDILLYESYFISNSFYNVVKNEEWFNNNELFQWYEHPVIPYMISLDDHPKNEDLHTFVFGLFLSEPPVFHNKKCMIDVARYQYFYNTEL